MADGKKVLSYLSRRPIVFTAEELAGWGFPAFGLLTLTAITLLYLILAAAYLAMVSEGKTLFESKPASPAAAEEAGISLPQSLWRSYLFKSQEAGRLMVVTGRARNNYPEAVRHIKLRGEIVSADGHTLAERFVYAGNIISRKNLGRLPLAEILIRLSEKHDQITPVPPKGQIAFMIVFDDPPQNHCEYQIEVADFEPLAGTNGAADEK